MAIGDLSDMRRRLRVVLPSNWFPDDSPVLDGVLSGIAAIWSWAWSLLDYVARQRRIATATDINLEMISDDFLGASLPRREGESDDSYRLRIKASIFKRMGTRQAVSDAVTVATGSVPKIFEPARPSDTGGWGARGASVGTGLGYGAAGGYGSYNLPFQAFITAYRPSGATGANHQGYSSAQLAPYLTAIGGYRVGAIGYLGGQSTTVSIADSEIYGAVEGVRPIATIMWVGLTDGTSNSPVPPTQDTLDYTFILDISPLS